MPEDLITESSVLRPLRWEDFSSLNRDLEAFEDLSGLTLAPFLLDEGFLSLLGEKTASAVATGDESDDWTILWAIMHDGETIIGFLDFSGAPGESGRVTLRWTFTPDWIGSPLAAEAVRAVVDWAFSRDDCRTIVIGEGRPLGEMERVFRRLGFRTGRETTRAGEPRALRLTKAVEGKLL